MSFARRYSSTPSLAEITKIEGTVVVDNTVPSAPTPVGTGVAAIVGEFADCSTSVLVDASGNVTTNYTPTEVFGETDIRNKFGGWDETLGEFGVTEGSGYVARYGKSFARLILCAINNASSKAVRLWRQLPTNKSATDPTPAQPMQGAVVKAGYQFTTAGNRARTCKRVAFTGTPAFYQSVTGSVTNGAAAAHNTITGAGGFTTAVRPDGTKGVKAGDIIVAGVVGGAGALGANANVYRVQAATDDTHIEAELLDGTNFAFQTDAGFVFRIHTSDVADSGGQVNLAAVAGFTVPARALDATIAINTSVSPTVSIPSVTANYADPLAGLILRTHSVTGLVYTAALQAPNAGQSATLDTEYTNAINSFRGDALPQREVNLLTSARMTNAIRTALDQFAQVRKANGIGLVVVTAPEINQVSLGTVTGDAAPGVGATRDEETIYSWPGCQVQIPDAVGTAIKVATGVTTTDGLLDTSFAPFAVSLLSGIDPERSIAQVADPVAQILASVAGTQRGLPFLGIDEYTLMRSRGIAGLRISPTTKKPEVESEVTSSLDPAKKYIHRRRMSFYIQDTLALALAPYKDLPVNEQFRADVLIVHVHFFEDLLQPNQPERARIAAYALDDVSGNTADAQAAGAFFVSHFVELLSIAHNIVIGSTVGNGILSVSAQ